MTTRRGFLAAIAVVIANPIPKPTPIPVTLDTISFATGTQAHALVPGEILYIRASRQLPDYQDELFSFGRVNGQPAVMRAGQPYFY